MVQFHKYELQTGNVNKGQDIHLTSHYIKVYIKVSTVKHGGGSTVLILLACLTNPVFGVRYCLRSIF